ncbi:MAG: chloride channel protein [Acidimicrobiia bacterium]|nr:chloride channel protein [Acidimicrobiia bacterium]
MIQAIRRLVPEALNSKLLAASVTLGVLVGLAVAIFEYVVVEVVLHELDGWPFWAQAGAPLVGLVITYWLLRTIGGGCSTATSEEYLAQFHSRHPRYRFREIPARLLGGVATIGMGGAVGLEGPSIYLGSAFGYYVHRPLERHLGRGSVQQLLTAGAAAGVAAIFQAPATGVVFALESPYRDDMAHRALLPSLVASAASFLTFVTMPFIKQGSVVGFVTDRSVGSGELLGAVVLGVGAGLGGRGFAWFIRQAKGVAKRYPPSVLLGVGGVALGILAVASREVFGEPLTLGPGLSVFAWLDETASSTRLIVALFFFRAAATLTTVGAGGVGGLFIPLAVQGVLLGRVVGAGLDRLGLGEAEDVRLWPILGLAAFLAAGYRTPIAAVMFVAESTRGTAVVPALLAAAVSQLVAGSSSVSVAQREERLGGLESRLTLPVSAVIETDVLTVPPDASVSDFVWVHAMGQRQPIVPVVDGNTYLGLCSIQDAAKIERSHWDDTPVTDIVNDSVPTGRPSWTIRDVVSAMGNTDAELLAVTDENGAFIGLVRDSEIVKLDEILVETETSDSD